MRQLTANEKFLKEKICISVYFNERIRPFNPSKFREINEHSVTSLCPFHIDTDPSFHYWVKKRIFKCFGCGVAGDVIQLHLLTRKLLHKENMTRAQAIKTLATLYKINLNHNVEEDESIFARARQLTRKPADTVDHTSLTLGEFSKLNNKIINANIPTNVKVQNFVKLDNMLTASMLEG